jgi:DNA-binding response OmpR family regulator
MPKILIVEDEVKMAKLLMSDLKLEGFSVDHAADGATGLEKASTGPYDLLILDVMLPKMDGHEVCRALRAQGSRLPILMLTAKSQDMDKVVGFRVGADDYLTKPFNILELIARVKALLRRSGSGDGALAAYEKAGWKIDFRRQEAMKGKEKVALTSKEFQILQYLIVHRDQIVSREEFLRELWKYEEMPSTRTVDNQVASLRRKLGWTEDSKGPKILTIHNTGYRFVD